LAIYSISSSPFNRFLNEHNNGKCAVHSQTKKKRKTKTFIAKACMDTAFSTMGDKMPDSITIHLPCYLNYKTIYAYMIEDLTLAGETETLPIHNSVN
jgi:hypothetical protein